MGKLIITGAGLALAAALGTYVWQHSFSSEAQARKTVAPLLHDPSSAQFRNLRAKNGFLCGEVNGKNRLGAYVGFRPFASIPEHGPSSVTIANDGESIAEMTAFCDTDG